MTPTSADSCKLFECTGNGEITAIAELATKHLEEIGRLLRTAVDKAHWRSPAVLSSATLESIHTMISSDKVIDEKALLDFIGPTLNL